MLLTVLLGLCLFCASAQSQAISLTTEDVKELETYLQSFSNNLDDYARKNLPSKVSFSGGYCNSLKLTKYNAFKVKLRRLSGRSLELRILNGLVEGEAYCKVCKKFLWTKICAKAKPLARVSNLNFRASVRLTMPGGKPRLSLIGSCHLDLHFKIVKMRGKNLIGKLAGLFKKRISRKAEKQLEKSGCRQIHRAIAEANKRLCSFLGC